MLLDVSILYSLIHIIVLFVMLYEYRCSRRVFYIALLAAGVLWLTGNGLVLLRYGKETLSQLTLFTATLPSLLFFWLLARHRGGRFFFTFCIVDTVGIWLILFSGLVGHYLGGSPVVVAAIRFAAFPLLEWWVWKRLRKPYVEMQAVLERGWTLFAATTGVFYVLLLAICGYPTILTSRPEDMPTAVLTLALMPMVYLTIFRLCYQQMEAYRAQERLRVLRGQADMLKQQADVTRRLEERLRIERHDLRHRLAALGVMLRRNEPAEALSYIDASVQAIEEAKPVRYCNNAFLNAVASCYFQRAEEAGVRVEARLSIAEDLPVDAAEFSTVLANALENALNACEKLPQERREIRCRCVSSPALILEISNPYAGEVRFGADGLPIAQAKGHGVGYRSIVAFCHKYNAVCACEAKDGRFALRVALPQGG